MDRVLPCVFPSEEWVTAYREQLNASAEYGEAARTWTQGAIAMVIEKAPERGLHATFCFVLDVEGGHCRTAKLVTLEQAHQAPFCLTASYPRWQEVVRGRLDPIAGMVTRKIQLKGSLVIMMRYVRSAKAMVACAARVPSRFLDEEQSAEWTGAGSDAPQDRTA